MTDTLLWDIPETARQLGGMTPRSVWRLIAADKLVVVRIGRRTFVDPDSARMLIDSLKNKMTRSDNPPGAAVLEKSTCRERNSNGTRTGSTGGRTRGTGGARSPTKAAVRLAAVLGSLSPRTRKD
jgi:hypothetical protein